jgi:hypothetical protein
MSQGEQPESPSGDQTGAEPPAPVPVSDTAKPKRSRTPAKPTATDLASPGPQSPAPNREGANVEGGVTGIGIGLLIALWASAQPDGIVKTSCFVMLPIITTIVDRTARWMIKTMRQTTRDREHREKVDKMRATLTAALANELTSAEHKEKMKAELEELERYDVRFQKDALQSPPS